MDASVFKERVFEAARSHGRNSHPEHEVGDLQAAVIELVDELDEESIEDAYSRLTSRLIELEST